MRFINLTDDVVVILTPPINPTHGYKQSAQLALYFRDHEQAKRSTASEPATFGSAYGDWTDRF